MTTIKIKEGQEYLWDDMHPQSGESVHERVKLIRKIVRLRCELRGSPRQARNKPFPVLTEGDWKVEIERESGETLRIKASKLRPLTDEAPKPEEAS